MKNQWGVPSQNQLILFFLFFLQTTLSYLEFLKKLRASDCSSSINGCDHMLLFLTEAKIWHKFCLYFEHFNYCISSPWFAGKYSK